MFVNAVIDLERWKEEALLGGAEERFKGAQRARVS